MLPEQPSDAPAPVEEDPKTLYGKDFENLPKEIQDDLRTILEAVEKDDEKPRAEEVKKILHHRNLWKGLQYGVWRKTDGRWEDITAMVGREEELSDIYHYVTNIYQAYGLTFIATLTSNLPTVRFWPQSPTDDADRATAAAANKISELVTRNNELEDKGNDAVWFLWTDGGFGGYVRPVTDGQRFGYTETPIMEPQEQVISPDSNVCAQCGYEEPAEAMSAVCPQCGTPMGPENFRPAQTAQVPVQTGIDKQPKAEEVIDFVSLLELKRSSYAKTMRDLGYIKWDTEVPVAKLKALYPNIAKKINAGDHLTDDDDRERSQRMSLTRGAGDGTSNTSETLATYSRAWLRPWEFQILNDEKKIATLVKIFPDGAHVVFAGDTYCESRNESMDKRWRFCYALPGDGQQRESVGGSLVSVQERYNTLCNIEVETHEHGIPLTIVGDSTGLMEALDGRRARPGDLLPAQSTPGFPLGNNIYQTEPGKISPQLPAHRTELMGPIAQFLSGMMPALFGQEMAGNDTASGYAMQRDQAMGRMGLVWRNYRRFMAELMAISVECFKETRSEDVEMAVQGPAGSLDAQIIHLDDLSGKIYAYPKTDEDFPISWSQKKNVAIQMLESQNPAVQAVFAVPSNMEDTGRLMGSDLKMPGADARAQQFREIAQLLLSPPMPPAPMLDPMTGAMVLGPPQPTIPIDPDLDDGPSHIAAGMEYAASEKGQQDKIENPDGYANFRAHHIQHVQLENQRMQQQMMAQAAASAPAEKPSESQDPETAQPPIQ